MHPHPSHRLPDPQYCPYTRHHVHFSFFFFGFLRCSELAISSKFDPATNPTISDLTILDSETISFLIKQSKTDQVKKGHFVYIFNLPSPLQPYQAVHKYLRLRIFQAKSPLEPLFLDHAGKPASRTWFQKHLKAVLLSAGISARNFSSHSFRIGAATSAAQKGLTKHQIQTLGRWSSEAFQSYIRTDQSHIKSAHKNSCFIKIGASFPGFDFLQITRLARLPLLTPRTITYDRASQQKTCLFHPAAGESHPARLRAAISSQVTASASRPPSFTFPSLPVRQWVLISRWTPARASRPDNITFSTPRPARLTHPDREYFPPVGCRREPPGQTSYIFMSLPVQRSESWSSVGRRRGAPGQTILLLCLYLSNAASLDLPLDAGEVLPARQILLSSVFTCPTRGVLISRWMPARCSRPDNLTFSVFTCPTQQVLVSRWTPARCSRPDESYFSCLYLSNTASLNLPLDAGEVLPARQSYFSCLYLSNTGVSISHWTPARCSRPDKRSSVCLHQKYRTPSNATYPAILASLAFSPPPARFHHPAHKYQSHLRCRKSLPAGQPHLFLLRQRS